MNRSFDAVVIGAGQAGPPLAARLVAAGRKVAIVERKFFGGTCVNTGCTPTKAMVASAYAAYAARRGADYGFSTGPVTMDMKSVKARKDAIVEKSRNGLASWLEDMDGCTVLRGHARFTAAKEIDVDGEGISADAFFINVGGRARVPDMPGLDNVDYLTNASIMNLDILPEHLAVVGGSYIGLEFAQMYRRFGSRVTVIEKSDRLVTREDEEVSQAIAGFLEKEGIVLRLGAECISFSRGAAGIEIGVDCDSGDRSVAASHVLLAVGRRPNTDDLGLGRAGIETDEHGYIVVDDQLRTSVDNIWALGECNGRGAFTHTSYNDYEILAANLLDGASRRIGDRVPVYALYTDPPLGRAGMTETEARKSGRHVLVGTRPMSRVSRAVEKGETEGLMKIVADAESKEILGAAILGPEGDEVVHGVLDAIYTKAPYTAVQRTVRIHPTVSELIPTVLGEMKP